MWTAPIHFDIEFFTKTLKKTKNILHIDQLNGTSGFNFSIAICQKATPQVD